mmetsp:Transcript_17601/g.56914  ORF Transcript_17601/g.56914 Transcript_17601/m.56914 type:complete len:87 (-) Transcript_17601:692-952(-)
MVAPAYPLAAVVGLVLHRRPRRAPGVISIDGTLVTRLLQEGDRSKGFLELLGQLTTVGEISEGDWKRARARPRPQPHPVAALPCLA